MVRCHYIDPRWTIVSSVMNNPPPKISILQKTGSIILDYINNKNRSFEALFEIIKKLKVLKSLNGRGIRKYYNDYFRDTGFYIGKELSRSYLGEEILNFTIDIITKTYGQNILKIEQIIKYFEDNLGGELSMDNILHYLKVLDVMIATITAAELDAYALARMFKVFKDTPSEDKSKLFESVPKNIIFYGGYYHSINIRKFLKIQDFIKVEEARETLHERCIDISNIEQPLFS